MHGKCKSGSGVKSAARRAETPSAAVIGALAIVSVNVEQGKELYTTFRTNKASAASSGDAAVQNVSEAAACRNK